MPLVGALPAVPAAPNAMTLPIATVLPELRQVFSATTKAVLAAPPGSGKTTGVPLALLDEPWLHGRGIVILEPRRLAARAAAARMAELRNEPVGRTVGYRVRFDRQVSKHTRIEVLTEGILTRRLQNDLSLEEVGLVIFDEFHERSLHADLALALCLDAMAGLRDDLRLLVMSATLDTARIAKLLGNAAVVTGHGREYPVAVRYLPSEPDGPIAETTARGIRRALTEEEGDILAFLPGGGEIRKAAALLARRAEADGLSLVPLYGDLPKAAQDRAIRPDPAGRRRVVLATAIAETSLTIEGITTVVDSGWSRVPRFDANSGLSRLETVRVSHAAAAQRTGRAGRLGPGVCYRLWTEHTDRGLVAELPPEILAADLAPLALELALWGVGDPADLAWLDPPPGAAFGQALDLLRELAALDRHGHITELGRRMANLPVHPRLAHMLCQAEESGQTATACDLAALLAERDLLKGGRHRPVDIELRLELLASFRRHPGGAGAELDPAACRAVDRAAAHWRRLLAAKDKKTEAAVGPLLSLAYPDRICQRRGDSRNRYLMANGRGATLPPHDPLAGSDYLVAAHLDAGTVEGRIFLAAPLSLADLCRLHADRIEHQAEIVWDHAAEAVAAREQERLGALVLESRPLAEPDPEAVRAAMLAGIRALGPEALPWTRSARDLQARGQSLRQWLPEEEWPDLSEPALLADLDSWLAPFLDGISRRDQFKRLDLAAILSSRLSWDQLQRLDREAPSHLTVPSGSRLRLRYTADGEPPVLAARLQELFGLAETPRIAGGRVAVMLHLLSPAQRPVQMTTDLASFWNTTYQEVKKELKGRYPKHHWPDDPWSAIPTASTKRRR